MKACALNFTQGVDMYKLVVFFMIILIFYSCTGKQEGKTETDDVNSVPVEDSAAVSREANIEIDDDLIRQLLPQYPNATVFKLDYLEFFAAEAEIEKELAENNDNKYIVQDDFDRDDLIEFAVAGLADTAAMDNMYQAFVVILELQLDSTLEIEYFETFNKHLGTDDMTIRNIALKQVDQGIMVIFANNTDFGGYIIWDHDNYKFVSFN